jgi:hypothetical protein
MTRSRSNSKWRCGSLVALIFILIGCASLRAQSSNGQISGQVTDPTSAVIPNAQIIATNGATNVSYTSTSNSAGIYVLPEMLPGIYKISVRAQGFGTANRSGLKLSTGDNLSQNFILQTGMVETTVTVSSAAPLISADTSATSDVLDNKMITELPQLNRNSLDLTSTIPSVQGSGPLSDNVQSLGNAAYLLANHGNSYSLSGGEVNGTSILVDGNQVQEAEFNSSNRSIPTPDTIAEFRVETGALTADKGRYSGGIISMETQSGGNDIHGRAFFYYRDQNLNSNDWLNNAQAIPLQPFKQLNYGAAAGGPVRLGKWYDGRDRTFFFFGWEGERFTQSYVQKTSVPTVLNQQGDFSQTVINNSGGNPVFATIYDPFNGAYHANAADCTGPLAGQSPCWVRPQFPGSKIPVTAQGGLSGQSTLFANYLPLWPSPNHAPDNGSDHANNYWSSIHANRPTDKFFFRGDENFRAAQHVNFSLGRSMMTDNIPAPFFHAGGSITTDDDWTGSLLYNWAVSPKSIVNLHLGFGTTKLISTGVSGYGSAPDPSIDTSKWPFDPLIVGNAEKSTLQIPPALNISGYTPVGGSEFDSFITQTANGSASFTRLIGRHTLKAGYEQYFVRFTEKGGDHTGVAWVNPGGGSNQYWNQNDGLTGSPLAELMMGSSNYFQWGNWDITPFGWNQAAYVMDDWKVNTKLNVQLGLRWDHDGARAGRHPQGSLRYDLNAKNVLSANGDWNWNQVLNAEPGLANLPAPAWLSQGATGRVALLDTPEYPEKNLYTTNWLNLEPRLGISYAVNDKTVLHLSAGFVDQGLNGLSTDYFSFYYNSNTFNQISSLDGQHWVSEFGNDHGLGTFPLQASGSRLGFVPPIATNKDYWYATFGGAANFDQGGTLIGHYDTPMDYMWGVSVQRQLGNDWAFSAEYQGIKGVHLLTPVWGWSLNNTPLNYYQLGTHLQDQVPNPFFGQSQTFASEPTVPLFQLLALSPQYSQSSPGQATWGKSFSNFANFQIQSRNYRGLALTASYAIRKTLTNTGGKDIQHNGPAGSGLLQNPHNLMEAYGLALYEMPETLKLNYSYDLPFGRGRQFLGNPNGFGGHVLDEVVGGWALAGISIWNRKGTPVLLPTVDGGVTAPGAALRWSLANHNYKRSSGYGKAVVVSGGFVDSTGPGILNADSFVRTPDFSIGNAPFVFSDLRSPGSFYTDASLLKKFAFSENQARYFEMRVEAQNAFNHPVFGNVIADPDSPTFGGINGKSGSRIMQAGLRLFF